MEGEESCQVNLGAAGVQAVLRSKDCGRGPFLKTHLPGPLEGGDKESVPPSACVRPRSSSSRVEAVFGEHGGWDSEERGLGTSAMGGVQRGSTGLCRWTERRGWRRGDRLRSP